MPFDIESNTRTQNRSNYCLVFSLVITGIMIVAGTTMGVLYGTGVIWRNGVHDLPSYFEGLPDSDDFIMKNLITKYKFQEDVPF